jgi:hypothetical protein
MADSRFPIEEGCLGKCHDNGVVMDMVSPGSSLATLSDRATQGNFAFLVF